MSDFDVFRLVLTGKPVGLRVGLSYGWGTGCWRDTLGFTRADAYVSLHNGPKTFVVTGPPKSLFGLVTSLRKVRAQIGLDQSKTPFSQRKPVFSIRFLIVGVPYHSEYLDGVTDTVEEDLEDEEFWEAKDLKIPVYNTEDGINVSPPNLDAYKLIFYVYRV